MRESKYGNRFALIDDNNNIVWETDLVNLWDRLKHYLQKTHAYATTVENWPGSKKYSKKLARACRQAMTLKP